MKVLEKIRNEFPETAELIDDCLEQECKIDSRSGNFSSYISRSKILAQRNIIYFVVPGFKAKMFLLHLTTHVKLNRLIHDIYSHVV